MRPKSRITTSVKFAIIAGVACAGLGIPGAAQAATAAQSSTVAPLATVNLGLSVPEAKCVQTWLAEYYGYTGPIDGLLGTDSWKAMQRWLKAYWGYTGPIDGIVGSGTVSALQRSLRDWGYTGEIDGIAGPDTQAALQRAAASEC
ncbi:peptidoglycan-binding domain-containing protein [Streptomyces sp. RFCAC02]|uniref:peptidoglycan-binding domain-containing protein n=1 Tax=Streptomyces sp. RFCAC02 TaxID=2499143 RepID=UPI00102215F5|nr:peptidoglycan-binding domain-containing protein [Streptomyces sp. RFCAC02]